ncbi:MAG: 50S ribosomal protein L31 [Planctomycetales bacterium]|nr:50S ribosomal protein L31 [Planctomycetales bacterium]
MKSGIHPRYRTATVTCGCGEKFTTRSTKEHIGVEICSKCHPFYTGRQKFVDTAGRIEKFQKKYGWNVAETAKAAAGAAKAAKAPQAAK